MLGEENPAHPLWRSATPMPFPLAFWGAFEDRAYGI